MYKSRSILTSLTDTVHFHLFKNNLNTDLLTSSSKSALSFSVFPLSFLCRSVWFREVCPGWSLCPSQQEICQPFGMCLWHAHNCESTGLYMCVAPWWYANTKKKRITLWCILTPSSFRPSFHTRCHGDKIKLTLFWAYRRGGERSEQNCLMKTHAHTHWCVHFTLFQTN